MNFFNSFVDKGLLDRLNHVINSEFGRVTYTEAIKLLEEHNDKFEYKVSWVFLISYSAIKAMKKDFGKMTKEEIIAVCQGTGESTQTNETEEKTEIKLAKSTDGNSKQSKATRDEKQEQKTIKKMKCQKA